MSSIFKTRRDAESRSRAEALASWSIAQVLNRKSQCTFMLQAQTRSKLTKRRSCAKICLLQYARITSTSRQILLLSVWNHTQMAMAQRRIEAAMVAMEDQETTGVDKTHTTRITRATVKTMAAIQLPRRHPPQAHHNLLQLHSRIKTSGLHITLKILLPTHTLRMAAIKHTCSTITPTISSRA